MLRRGRRPLILFVLSVLGCATVRPADDVYRTVDAQGNVTYSDRAIASSSRKMTVDVIAADPENVARLAKEQAVLAASQAEQAKASRKSAAEQQEHQSQAAAQAHRCEAARTRYAMFAAGGRIWRPDSQGNRVFYSDQEIATERGRSKDDMDSACAQQAQPPQ